MDWWILSGMWQTERIPFFGPAALEAVNSVKVDQVVNSCEKWKSSVTRFPWRGSHSAPEWDGWAKHTLTLVFSYTQFPRWEGRRWNGMVKGPQTWRCFNIEVSHLQWCDDDARERRGKGFRGSSMNHHGNKQRKSGVTACTTVRHVRLQPPPVASSLAIRHCGGGWPPALLSGGNGNGGIPGRCHRTQKRVKTYKHTCDQSTCQDSSREQTEWKWRP